MIQKLDDVSQGKQVWRGEGQAMAHPSIYSREFCGVIRLRMLEYSRDHPFLPVRCCLDPLFREMEFISDTVKRTDFHSKAEEFAQKLVRKHKEQVQRLTLDTVCINVNEIVSNSTNKDTVMEEIIDTLSQGPSARRNVGGKKRPFELFLCADSALKFRVTLDKVSKYNLVHMENICDTRKKFWETTLRRRIFSMDGKKQFPNLYAVAARVLATPVSSASSERVFSVPKLVADDKWSRRCSSVVDDMIVVRSLHK